MTKKYLIVLITLIIATTLGSIVVVIKNVEYYSWYKDDVIGIQEFLVARRKYEETILKKYPEEEITTQTLSQMLKQENKKVLGDIKILLPAKKKIAGILTDETTYSVTNSVSEDYISGSQLVELAKNQKTIDLRGKPYFLDDKTKNIIDESNDNFIKESTFFGRLEGYKKYLDTYGLSEESGDIYYSLKPIIVTNIIYFLLFGFTVYWVRKYYKLSRKV